MSNEYLDALKAESGGSIATGGAAPAAANPYLNQLQAEDTEQKIRLRASLSQAVTQNPGKVTQQRQAADLLGYPLAAVRAMPQLEQQARVQAIDNDTQGAPTLRRAYTDAEFAALAHDDSGTLSAFSNVASFLSGAAKYTFSADPERGLINEVKAFPFAMGRQLAGVGKAAFDTLAIPEDAINSITGAGAGPLRRYADALGRTGTALGKSATELGSKWAPDSLPAQIFGGGAGSGVNSALQNLGVGVAASWLLGPEIGIPVTLAAMAFGQGGETYQKDSELGVPYAKRLLHAGADALAEYVGEKYFGIAGLLKRAAAGSSAGKLMMYEMTHEQVGEIGTTLWQNFNEWMVVHPDKSVADFLAEQPAAIAQTMVATLVGGGLSVGAVKALHHLSGQAAAQQQQADQAEQHVRALAEMTRLAEASKLRERSAETFGAFAQQVADSDVPNLYVNAQVLNQAGVDMQALAEALPSVAEQVQVAMATGGDLVIPTGEFLTAALGQAFLPALIEHVRTSERAMSAAEGKDYMTTQGDALQTEMARVLQERQGDDAFQASRAEVQAGFLQQLNEAGRFTPDVHEKYATLLGSYYAVQAAKMGITPAELAARYPLQINAKAAGEASLFTSDKAPRAQLAIGADITQQASVITLLEGADLSSFTHESGHFFLEMHADLAARIQAQISDGASVTDGEREIVADMNRLLDWFGVKGSPEKSALDAWHTMTLDEKRGHHEQFARGFEAYAFEGKSPSVELQSMFGRLRAWMLQVYKDLKALNVELTDEVRGVMDRMLASTEEIKQAEAVRSMGPLFTSAEQMGRSAEEFTAYHALALDATAQAIHNLEQRGLRDMKWLTGAKSRKVKELQKLVAGMRQDARQEVRREVMSQPVYRAWQFLTGKATGPDEQATLAEIEKASKAMDPARDSLLVAIAKLGGINRDSARRDADLDDYGLKVESGVFGMPVFRKEGGLSADHMRELLTEAGYLHERDEFGRTDLRALTDDIAAEIGGDPQYSFFKDYNSGDQPAQALPDSQAFGKLHTDILRQRYGTKDDAVWRKLSARHMTSEALGVDPEVVAATFGFDSGDALVQALAAAEPPNQVIEQLTDQRMLQKHGDLGTPAGLERAVDEALHTEMRARAIATELQALQDAGTVKDTSVNFNTGRRNTVDVLARAARDLAQSIVGTLRVRDIRPGQYMTAAARHAKDAEKALKAGKTAEAAAAKRNQLIQHEAARAAQQAQTQVDSALAYFKRVQRPGALPATHHEQIVGLLAKFSLSNQTNKALDNAARFRTWAKAQLDAGNVPPNVDALLSPEQRKRYALELQRRNDDGELVYADEDDQALLLAGFIDETPVRNWREVSVEELNGLRDTIKQIEHIGRRTKKVLTDRKNREFAAVVDAMRKRIEEVAARTGRKSTDTRTPNDQLGQRLLSWRGFWFSHIKVANLAHIMDGGEGGPVWEHLVATANKAANGEVMDIAASHDAIQGLLAPVKAQGAITDTPQYFPSIDRSLNRQARIVMALNMGNESNQQRLLGGEGWTLDQIKPVLDTLTAADWQFVQGMWDHYETYRPRVAAMERLINGVEPDWVVARSMVVQTADGQKLTLRGGYAPVIYDPRASGTAASHAAAKDAKGLMQAARVASSVNKSFTKARVEEVKGRPLLLSLDAMVGGVQDTIHYLHWQPWIIDANRLVKALDAPIRKHYGATVVTELRNWVGDNAAGMQGPRTAAERAVVGLARNVSFAGLAFNVMSAVKQVTGYSQSVAVIGAKWMARGAARSIASPRGAYLEAVEKSDFMKKRATTRMRDLAEVNNTVQDQSAFRKGMDRGGYAMMLVMQSAVDVPTWWGAYEKAIDGGQDDEGAIALADQAVIDSQGGGLQKDLSSVERATGAIRLLTGFMSFMNTTLNVNYRVLKSEQGVAGKAVDLLLVNTVPVVLSMMLGALLTPGDGGDDDPEKLAKKFLAEQTGFLLGQALGLREISQLGYAAMGSPQGDYSGSVGLRLAADSLKLAKQVGQGQMDDALRKALVNVAGETLRLPAAQINRTWTGIEAVMDGQTDGRPAPSVAAVAAPVLGFQKPR